MKTKTITLPDTEIPRFEACLIDGKRILSYAVGPGVATTAHDMAVMAAAALLDEYRSDFWAKIDSTPDDDPLAIPVRQSVLAAMTAANLLLQDESNQQREASARHVLSSGETLEFYETAATFDDHLADVRRERESLAAEFQWFFQLTDSAS